MMKRSKMVGSVGLALAILFYVTIGFSHKNRHG
jgi:hypothetical protein